MINFGQYPSKIFDFNAIPSGIFAVGVQGTDNLLSLCGTAFLLDKPGYLATAAHVVGMNDDRLMVGRKGHINLSEYQDAGDKSIRVYPAKIFAISPFHDLAILKIENESALRSLSITGIDDAPVGTGVSSFGYPHADSGRCILTQQNGEVGARILLPCGGVKAKYLVLNALARPGQSGSPIFRKDNGNLVAVLSGAYVPDGGGRVQMGNIDPATLHQTTHAVSAEYLKEMY